MPNQRVSRACDSCKRRKIRCTGKLPCAHCIKNNKTCEFKAAYTRGAVPEVQSAPVEEQEKYLEEVGYKRRQVWRPSPTRRLSSCVQRYEQYNEQESEDLECEPTRTDRTYLITSQTLPSRQLQERSPGISSQARSSASQRETNTNNSTGESFYERTQNCLRLRGHHQKNPVSAYGDPQLPEIDTSFLIFPSENTAQALIQKYFDVVSVTNRILHQPTVEKWTCKLLNNVRGMRTEAEENSQRAVVLMVFASAHEYMDYECGEDDADISFYYFQAAENQLAKETGEIRLATLQARLLQCWYLLSRSRINQCYSIFGVIVNFIYTLEIHRERKSSNKSDLLEIELQKRVFWFVYITDKYLSSALGRPQMFHDEDIDQQLPLFVDDKEFSSYTLQTTDRDAPNPTKGVIFQIRLAKILSSILRELYSIQKRSLTAQFASAEKLNAVLREWRSEITHFLDVDPSLLSPLYRLQIFQLRLSYSQALIILHRPFLFDSFDGNLDLAVPALRAKLEENVNRCIDASLDVVKTIDDMYKGETSFRASWFAHYCGYVAIVALFVLIIKRCTPDPAQISSSISTNDNNFDSLTWVQHFDAATKCQEQIKSSMILTKESFAQKCSVVLEGLRAEAIVKIREVQSKGMNNWSQSEKLQHRPAPGMEEPRQEPNNEAVQVEMEETSFFGVALNDMNFDQSSPRGGVGPYSIFNGLNEILPGESTSLTDRIDRWGFSSLTGY